MLFFSVFKILFFDRLLVCGANVSSFGPVSAARAARQALVEMGQNSFMESLILAQNERWRRGLGMQVERSFSFFEA